MHPRALFIATLPLLLIASQGQDSCESGGDTPTPYDPVPMQTWNITAGWEGEDAASAIVQTRDGGYAVAGMTFNYGSGPDYDPRNGFLLKLDADGEIEWERQFHEGQQDFIDSVAQTNDGGFIIAGTTLPAGVNFSDAWLIKTDAHGNEQWERFIGGPRSDGVSCVQQTTDGGYIMVGDTNSMGEGPQAIYLVKVDEDGFEQWSTTFGGDDYDYGASVAQTRDGGYIIGGATFSFGAGHLDGWLIKTDALGREEWNTPVGGDYYDRGRAVVQTQDGGYVLAGESQSYSSGDPGYLDAWMVKVDANGHELWNETYGGIFEDKGYALAESPDGGLALAGYLSLSGQWTSKQHYLVKTDAQGQQEWFQTFGGLEEDALGAVAYTLDGGYIVAGRTDSYAPDGQIQIIKTDEYGDAPALPRE